MFDNFMREHDFFSSPAKSLSDVYVNGMDAMIMQSDSDADKIIAMFKSAMDQGYEPEDVEQDIYMQLNINPDDILWYDKDRIQKEVNDYYQMFV